MQTWLLQTLSDVLNCHQQTEGNQETLRGNSQGNNNQLKSNFGEKKHLAELKAQREWVGAIAALEQLLLSQTHLTDSRQENYQGLIFSAPAPIVSNLELLNYFPTGIFTPDAFNAKALMPSSPSSFADLSSQDIVCPIVQLPLLPKDPIATEQFCLIFTTNFALVMVLGQDRDGVPAFNFSFEPEVIEQIWSTLRSRLIITNYNQLPQLDELVEQFAPPTPDYRLVSQFSRQLLKNLPALTALALGKAHSIEAVVTPQPGLHDESGTSRGNLGVSSRQSPQSTKSSFCSKKASNSPSFSLNSKVGSQLEMELLQALTHEIRTPLTTIRTLTKLILKRQKDFTPKVIKYLQAIDQECTEQIDRMELIFRAAELESTPPKAQCIQLTKFSLEQIFQHTIPRWQKQAQKRNVDLDVVLPQQLPNVFSDPAMLDRILIGLMESYTRSLPNGGQISVNVSTAGNQLKLQLTSKCSIFHNPLKSLGQLLMFQPETGCLSLSQEVTKNIFQVLGGKLTIRKRPHQEEITIFLPLGNPNSNLIS
ncbi:MAG: HAMP domain-containing sensor histidine kinase [Xenococcaceae cyanobacterium MO_188.B29]|nr:HAMP domain-containing sensor histidine kinase [Xenococcaceae cyanobacterium MO_188.B29]